MNGPWYESFFTPLALDFWRAAVPSEATLAEADFLERWLSLRPPARLLDLPCGLGRHAIELAARGYRVTGIDLSPYAVEEARREAGARGVSAKFVRGELRDAPPGAPFDGALCMGNSFGYLDAEGTRSFVRNVLRSLRPGGRWVIDTGCAAESILPHLRDELRMEAGGIRFEVKSRYDALEGRLVSECLLSRGDEREAGLFSHAVCTAAEIRRLFEAEGGRIIAALGSCDDAPFTVGDRRLLLVAELPQGTAPASP